MDIIISNTSGEPIYQQIIEQIKRLVVTEKMMEGEMLPSIRQLAKDLRISVITTKRAYEELEREGFIQTIPGKGSYIAPYDRELVKESQLRLIEDKLKDVMRESKVLNLSIEEVIDMIRILDEERID